ncbi:MAG: DNA mismatch repair protein MutS [Sphaerobacteraceae bacterium]|nr:MAG: DNA mismatch repair protein MutS [Sphaerobacteraceae bacterium]
MTTPIRRQYLSIKKEYPDVVVFFRLGDFYETFDDDAKIASSVLDITLTSREMGKGTRIPMAGIPYHAAQNYVSKLIDAGHKVAMVEQITEPDGKQPVERKVTRVVTPGTVTDPSMLESESNRFIAATLVEGARAGLAIADITTGEFLTTQMQAEREQNVNQAVHQELLRLNPAEIVISDDERIEPADFVPNGAYITRSGAADWRAHTADEALREHFQVDSLDAYGCRDKPLAVRAAGALLQYLGETQLNSLAQIVDLVTYSTEAAMMLDAQTRRNLELLESTTGDKSQSLVAVLDQTKTPMGARRLRRWVGQPLLDLELLSNRQDGVQFFAERALVRTRIREALQQVSDIERLINRAITGTAGPRDIWTLANSLDNLPVIDQLLNEQNRPSILRRMPECSEIVSVVRHALVDDPPAMVGPTQAIRAGFSAELDAIRTSSSGARQWIANLERTERERTGIKNLKVGYNKVFGYYIEVSRANVDLVPDDYQRKQTLVGGERYITPELKEYENRVLNADEQITELEQNVFRRLVAQVVAGASLVRDAADAIADIDTLASFAEASVRRGYVRPVLDDGNRLEITGGRHPVVEMSVSSGSFVPNDTRLDTDEAQIAILTGPNMAGKSTYLRQTALIALMAQIGSFVPADQAHVGLIDRIFTRIGAQDDISSGQSTFMVEMVETASILHHASSRSLVVLDEIGRGTSTYDGLAIARSVVEHLHNSSRLGCKTLFATHYHELTELADLLPRVVNYRVDVLEEGEEVVFLHRVVPGGADRSYGIHVARLAGMPRSVVHRAGEILQDLERISANGQGDSRREAMRQQPASPMQMTFFAPDSPVLDELKQLDIESLSPLEALTRLYELQRKVNE